jgi:hypothetical protein
MGLHDSFGHLKHKLWPKERPGVKLAVWLPIIKSRESTELPYVQVTCHIPLKSSWRGIQLCFRPHLNWRSTHKVMGPKVMGVPTLGISGLPFGSPETKCHLDVASWRGKKYTIKGKVVVSPKFGSWWILWVQVCPWFVLAPKVFKLCTNQLVVWFVQVHVSNWCLSLFLVPSRSSSTSLYPRNAASQGTCPNSSVFRYFHFKLTSKFIQGGVGSTS